MKKIASFFLILTIVISMLTGCSSGNKNPDSATGDSVAKKDIVIATDADAVSIDPQATWDSNSIPVIRQMYDQLVKLDANMKIVPSLAESWEYLSPTQLQFKLKKGVKFHDGTEMKASDVKFSIEREKASAKVKAFAALITNVKVVDDYTVVIETEKPFGPLLANLCHTGASIIPEKYTTEQGDKFGKQPIGTGAFKFVEWAPGDKIVLAKNENYFGGKVDIDTLTFRIIPEGSSRTIALETGEIDMNMKVDPIDAKKVESNTDLKLYDSLSPMIEYSAMNQKYEPFSKLEVREAINYAIDRNSVFDVVAEGRGKITNSVMNAKIPSYTDEVKSFEYNPTKAKELLAQAGYPNGFDVVMTVSGDLRNRTAQLIQANLAEVGIKMTIENLEWSTFMDKVNKGDYQMFILSYNNTTGDPDTSLYQLFTSTVPASSGNRVYYNNPKTDKLLSDGQLELDGEKRMAIYKEAQQVICEDVPWIPLYCKANLVGTRNNLQGYTPHPLGVDLFYTLHY